MSAKIYRLLNIGEPVQAGDEFYSNVTATWRPTTLKPGTLCLSAFPPLRRLAPTMIEMTTVLGPFVQLACEVERKQAYYMTQYGEAKVDSTDLERALKFYESLTPNPLVQEV